MTLHLPLKRKHFEAIKAGTKKYEYRLCTPYWQRRIENKTFDNIVLTLGYPPATNLERRIERSWQGYEVKTIVHRQFGKMGVKVFAIRVN